ncbi:Zn-dependent hydrolase [Paracoccus sp. MKU1]|uniref:Zn-dependent hydrolase n=1 Tax=Paracoccus sp. MKU1 TaxID=1745182 RepID=UPI0007191485|nr:Zn-dependent hydrolase [Paracoccus sp. MKU1]KRW95643.1 allantoate amidohydrolase [Paracoccus sp. MKU1]
MIGVATSDRCEVFSGDATDQLLARELFDALHAAAFDGTGITREAYSPHESQALGIIEAKARSLGLTTERDAGANLVITLEGTEPDLPFLACGSHLDSVPQGGNYDGAAGVIAGLAILAGFHAEGFRPRRSLKVLGLRGEESARFGRAYIGSSALLGALHPGELEARDRDGHRLGDCMAGVGADVARIGRGEALLDPARIAGWIELHIEQGPVLVARDLPIGIVTGIRGNLRHRAVECRGEAGHSGAVPRWLRRDAVFASAELVGHLDRHWRTLLERGRDLVVTCGEMGTDPREHAIARIPGTTCFSFEVRSQSREAMETFYDIFRSECAMIGEERGVVFSFDQRMETEPAVLDAAWIARLKAAAESLGLPAEEIPSGAGHDAAVFANAGIPSAMVFVRNQHGSHNPREAMEIGDFLAGIAVMRAAIREALE